MSLVLAVDGIPGDSDGRPVLRPRRGRRPGGRVDRQGDLRRRRRAHDRARARREQQHAARATSSPRPPGAVDTFLASAPDDVRIGLVAFAGDIGRWSSPPPTTTPCGLPSTGIELRKGTAVYDGIAEGLDLVGTEGSRSLLVLSDGGDTNSATTLDVVSNDATDEGVVVDVVSLANPKNAETMSDAGRGHTGGQVIPAEQDALGAVFSAQADALAQQLLVTFDRPEDAARARSTSA